MDWEQFLRRNEPTLSIDEWGFPEDKDRAYNMKDPIKSLKTLLKNHFEETEDIIQIEQKDPGRPFKAWTKHRIYFSETDDGYDMQVHWAFRHPPYVVVR